MFVEIFFGVAVGILGLSVICGFTAMKPGISNDGKRNIFLLSAVLALWSNAVMLAAILLAVT